jgi:hypothetical protein
MYRITTALSEKSEFSNLLRKTALVVRHELDTGDEH